MTFQKVEPPEELRHVIEGFWYGGIDFGKMSSSFEILPDGYTEIIFYFGSDCQVSDNRGLQLFPSPFLMGVLGQPVYIHAKNRLEVLGIRCFPWTVFDLLKIPAGQNGAQTFEHPIARLQSTLNKLVQAGRRNDALNQLKQYFLNAVPRIAVNRMVSKAGIVLRKTGGTLPVGQVATAVHTTVRTLERKFKQSSGCTVKDISTLIRFEQARNRLWLCPNSNIANLACELGYTDQSHLNREFKRYSKLTPAAFARRAKSVIDS